MLTNCEKNKEDFLRSLLLRHVAGNASFVVGLGYRADDWFSEWLC